MDRHQICSDNFSEQTIIAELKLSFTWASYVIHFLKRTISKMSSDIWSDKRKIFTLPQIVFCFLKVSAAEHLHNYLHRLHSPLKGNFFFKMPPELYRLWSLCTNYNWNTCHIFISVILHAVHICRCNYLIRNAIKINFQIILLYVPKAITVFSVCIIMWADRFRSF